MSTITQRDFPMYSSTASKLAIAAICLALGAYAHAAAPNGQRVFQNNCAMCHSASPDMTVLAGPPLFNVLGRRVAGAKGFAYSDALSAVGAKGQGNIRIDAER
jgi:cytochrome c2